MQIQLLEGFVHSSKWFLHTASLSSLANIFSRLLLIEHLIYLKHFVLFNCLKWLFTIIVDYYWIVVKLLKKGQKVILLMSMFSSFCLLLDIDTFVIQCSAI